MPINPNLGYSQLMAQMIAGARAAQAPTGGSGRRGVMGGGVPTQSTETAVAAKIDIDPWLRLFGVKKPEEMAQMVADLADALEARTPEERDRLLNTEGSQTVVHALAKSGAPVERYGFSKIRSTALGQPVYGYSPKSPEAKVAGKSEEQIYGIGGEPAKRVIEAKTTIAKAARGTTENEYMMGERGKEFIEKKIELQKGIAAANETEADKNLKVMTARNYEIAAQQHEQQMRLDPLKLGIDRKKADAEITYHMSLAKKADADAKKSLFELNMELDPKTSKGVLQANALFENFYNSFLKVHALDSNDAKSGFIKISEMEGAVESNISSMKTWTGKGQYGEAAVRKWMSLVDVEFMREPGAQYTWGGMGGPPKSTLEQQGYQRYYVKKGFDLLKQSDMLSADGLINKQNPSAMGLFTKVIMWGKAAGLTKEQIAYLARFGTLPQPSAPPSGSPRVSPPGMPYTEGGK